MPSSTARSFVLRGANVYTNIQSCEWTSRGLRIGGVDVRVVDVRPGVTPLNATELTRFATLTTPEGTFSIGMAPDVHVELSLTASYQDEAASSVTSEQPSNGTMTPPSRVIEVTPSTLERAALTMDKLSVATRHPPSVIEVAIMADKEVSMVNQSADQDALNLKLTIDVVRMLKSRLQNFNTTMPTYGFRDGFAEFTEPFIDVFTKKIGANECMPDATCNDRALTVMSFIRSNRDLRRIFGYGSACIEVCVYFMKTREVVKKNSASWPITYEGEKLTTFRLFDINMLRSEIRKHTNDAAIESEGGMTIKSLNVGEGAWIKESVLSPDAPKPDALNITIRNVAMTVEEFLTDRRSFLSDGITIDDFLMNDKYDRKTPHEMFIRAKPAKKKKTSKRHPKPKRGSPGT